MHNGLMGTKPSNVQFTTTRWSVVAASARPGNAEFRSALDELTRQYRSAIVAFIAAYYRCGLDEAEDIAQEFIVRWIEHGFPNADANRGRFRSYLRGALRHFVQNWRRSKQAKRRGGASVEPKSLDVSTASEVMDDTTLSPEAAFDQNYRKELFGRAIGAMKAEYAAAGREKRMKIFERYYIDSLGANEQPTYKLLAAEFDVPETDVTNALSHSRARLLHHVTALVRDSVSDAHAFQREMDALCRPTESDG